MSFQKIGGDGRPLGEPKLAALVDEARGLMWAAFDVSDSRMTFEEAKRACANFRCAGFDDWRVPEISELETLRDLSRFDPAADPQLSLKPNAYWSNTVLASSPRVSAWNVYFGDGNVVYGLQLNSAFVRAVRSVRAGQ
jgi:hypothetical protein